MPSPRVAARREVAAQPSDRVAERQRYVKPLLAVYEDMRSFARDVFRDVPPGTQGRLLCVVADAQLTIRVWANGIASARVHEALQDVREAIDGALDMQPYQNGEMELTEAQILESVEGLLANGTTAAVEQGEDAAQEEAPKPPGTASVEVRLPEQQRRSVIQWIADGIRGLADVQQPSA